METQVDKIETTQNTEIENEVNELKDKYLRLYAEFENFKKRVQKEKEDIRNLTKIETLHSVLDVDNDLSFAISKLENNDGLHLILSKIQKFLKSQGIEEIQTSHYDPEIHEVISVIETGEKDKILEVASKGYTLSGRVIRYPKVIVTK